MTYHVKVNIPGDPGRRNCQHIGDKQLVKTVWHYPGAAA